MGTACPYTINSNPTVAGPNPPTATCGFSGQNQAFCPVQIGDAAGAAIITAMAPIYSYANANCHVSSTGLSAKGCIALWGKYAKTAPQLKQLANLFTFAAQPPMIIPNPGMSALFQSSPTCV
jgi:hypothetical protein